MNRPARARGISGVHVGQQPGNLPPIPSIDLVQHLLLPVDVAVIEHELLAAAMKPPPAVVVW